MYFQINILNYLKLKIENCQFIKNKALNAGGVIFFDFDFNSPLDLDKHSCIIENSFFYENSA